MADESDTMNEVRVALDRAATSWSQLTGEGRQTFIRTLVRKVRYDGRTGKVTVQFDDHAFGEIAIDEAADRLEGGLNGNELQDIYKVARRSLCSELFAILFSERERKRPR